MTTTISRKGQEAPNEKATSVAFTIYYEWYGLDSSKDQPIVGGFRKCEEFSNQVGETSTRMQKESISRLRKIAEGLRRQAEGSDMAEVVDILDPIFQDCKKIDVKWSIG
jgi:hypothetical protein